ncbi:MAG: acetate--CoA ligase family protein, partial [Anaerolineales bacterium]|nr:acetate--CoA ligase family protein [Anaerolineales bacterium]
ISVMGDRLIQEAVEHLRAARIPEYRFPERAAAALSALVKRVELLKFAAAEPIIIKDIQKNTVQDILDNHDKGSFLTAAVTQQILEAYGIPSANMSLVENEKDAVTQAAEMGLPVVLKVASPDISHKTDVGGVLLNLADEKSIRGGFHAILEQAKNAQPEADITGVYVQEMVPLGQEVIVGAVQDPQFGPVMMFGSGGTEVEGLRDLAFGLGPLTDLEIDAMLNETWAGKKLHGFRNLQPADIKMVRDILSRLSQLASDFPQFAEIEINPLRVFPDGKGAAALDVRIRLEETGNKPES